MKRWLVLLGVLFLGGCGHDARLLGGCAFGLVHDWIVPPDRYGMGEGPYGIHGFRANGPLIWVVPVQGGVVVIDTGFDEGAGALRALRDREHVLAVLLTHGHSDHVAGAHVFDDVPVYLHADDLALLRGDEVHGAWPVELAELWMGRPPLPPDLRTVVDDACVAVSSAEFCAVHLPGHTPGSVGWHYRDVLFSGDALLIGRDDAEDLILLPSPEYPAASAEHLRRVQPMDLQLVIDGHWGWLGEVPRKIEAALAQYQREFADRADDG